MTQATLLPRTDQDAEQAFDPHLFHMEELERTARAIDVEDAILEQMRHAELELTIHLPAIAFRRGGVEHQRAAMPVLAFFRLHHGAYHWTGRISQPGTRFGFRQRLELRSAGTRVARRRGRNHLRSWAVLRARDAPIFLRLLPAASSDAAEFFRFFPGVRRQRAIHGWLGHDLEGVGNGFGAVRQAGSQWTLLARWITELIATMGQPTPRSYAIQGGAGLGLAIARAVSGCRATALSGSTGAKVIMMSDASGAILNDAGVDVAQLESHIHREQMLFGYPGAEHAYSADLARNAHATCSSCKRPCRSRRPIAGGCRRS